MLYSVNKCIDYKTMTNQIYIHPWKYARCETCKISKISQWV